MRITKYCKVSFFPVKDEKDFETLPVNSWNIPEPSGSELREEAFESPLGLDLILVPGLAFDEYKTRLGHGRGYYDKYLAKALTHSQSHSHLPPQFIGLSLSVQFLGKEEIPLPKGPLDIQMDHILRI